MTTKDKIARRKLSLLELATRRSTPCTLDELTPLVHDPAFLHVLHDVTAAHLVEMNFAGSADPFGYRKYQPLAR